MSDIKHSFAELIGNTPLYAASHFAQNTGAGAQILAKLEYFNPAGSVKDRVAVAMIDDAEARGALKPGATIIEPVSYTHLLWFAMPVTELIVAVFVVWRMAQYTRALGKTRPAASRTS